MAGDLVGLVIDHGPSEHNAWAVLVAIAEDLRGPLASSTLDNATLARATRLGRTSVRTAVAQLVAEEWVARAPGRHTGVASTYRLRLDRFPEDAVTALLERGRHTTPLPDSALSTGVATRPLSGKEGSPHGKEGSPHDPPSVSVTTPSPGARSGKGSPEDPLPVVVGVRTGPDDDELRTALNTFAVTPSRTLRAEIGDALDRGWTASAINARLLAEVDVRNCRDVTAVLVGVVRALDTPPAAPLPPVVHRAAEPDDLANPEAVGETVAQLRAKLAARKAGEAVPAVDGDKRPTTNGTPAVDDHLARVAAAFPVGGDRRRRTS